MSLRMMMLGAMALLATTTAALTPTQSPTDVAVPTAVTSATGTQIQTWCHGDTNGSNWMMIWHSGQDVWKCEWDYDLTAMVPGSIQRVNTVTQGIQDECKVAACKLTGNYLVAWSDRSATYSQYMSAVCRQYAPDHTPLGPEFEVSIPGPWPQGQESDWRPLISARPASHGGGWTIVWTGDYSEEVYLAEVEPGALGPLAVWQYNPPGPQAAKSQNYPDVHIDAQGRVNVIYMDAYTRQYLNGFLLEDGNQPRIGHGLATWEGDPSGHVRATQYTHWVGPFGPILDFGSGCDPFVSRDMGRWLVFESNVGGYSRIVGGKALGPISDLTPALGVKGTSEIFRRTPNTVTHGGRTVLFFTGQIPGTVSIRAYFSVIEP